MIKIVQRKTKVSIECSHADWAFLEWCLEEGLLAWMDVEDEDDNPSGSEAVMRAWKRNGRPSSSSQLPVINKRED
tara:strand:+ start:360 stop:584 length:225 start_codon:yes stop_codon:yes gene_type:complete